MPFMNISPLMLVYLLPVLFIGLWFLITFLISRVSGWSRLVDSYGADQPFFGTNYYLQSAQMRAGTNYNGCLTFGVNHEGLSLRTMTVFRMFHPPLFIPWSEVTAEPVKLWFIFNYVELRFQRAPEIPVKIRTSLAAKLALASNGLFRAPLAVAAGM